MLETLGYFDKNAKTCIIADASPVGQGAIPIQKQKRKKRVISYASKSLTDEKKTTIFQNQEGSSSPSLSM